MPVTLGNKPKTIFLNGAEAHKLHIEFEVGTGQTIKVGQPVVLNADGSIKPAGSAEDGTNIIGYSIHNGNEKEYVTIAMKAYAVVWAESNAAMSAGPVEYVGPGTDVYMKYQAASAAGKVTGWSLDEATAAGERIRVAIS